MSVLEDSEHIHSYHKTWKYDKTLQIPTSHDSKEDIMKLLRGGKGKVVTVLN
jgi:hypothetical protein